MLPQYKQRDVAAKDTLDVYIEHRMLLRQRIRGETAPLDPKNMYPMELLKRLWVCILYSMHLSIVYMCMHTLCGCDATD